MPRTLPHSESRPIRDSMVGDPVREAFQNATFLEPLEAREGRARQPLTRFFELGKRRRPWKTLLSQGQENRKPPMQCGKGAAASGDTNVLMETLPFSPGELAATHSPPEMYSDFLVTIYSLTQWVS